MRFDYLVKIDASRETNVNDNQYGKSQKSAYSIRHIKIDVQGDVGEEEAKKMAQTAINTRALGEGRFGLQNDQVLILKKDQGAWKLDGESISESQGSQRSDKKDIKELTFRRMERTNMQEIGEFFRNIARWFKAVFTTPKNLTPHEQTLAAYKSLVRQLSPRFLSNPSFKMNSAKIVKLLEATDPEEIEELLKELEEIFVNESVFLTGYRNEDGNFEPILVEKKTDKLNVYFSHSKFGNKGVKSFDVNAGQNNKEVARALLGLLVKEHPNSLEKKLGKEKDQNEELKKEQRRQLENASFSKKQHSMTIASQNPFDIVEPFMELAGCAPSKIEQGDGQESTTSKTPFLFADAVSKLNPQDNSEVNDTQEITEQMYQYMLRVEESLKENISLEDKSALIEEALDTFKNYERKIFSADEQNLTCVAIPSELYVIKESLVQQKHDLHVERTKSLKKTMENLKSAPSSLEGNMKTEMDKVLSADDLPIVQVNNNLNKDYYQFKIALSKIDITSIIVEDKDTGVGSIKQDFVESLNTAHQKMLKVQDMNLRQMCCIELHKSLLDAIDSLPLDGSLNFLIDPSLLKMEEMLFDLSLRIGSDKLPPSTKLYFTKLLLLRYKVRSDPRINLDHSLLDKLLVQDLSSAYGQNPKAEKLRGELLAMVQASRDEAKRIGNDNEKRLASNSRWRNSKLMTFSQLHFNKRNP